MISKYIGVYSVYFLVTISTLVYAFFQISFLLESGFSYKKCVNRLKWNSLGSAYTHTHTKYTFKREIPETWCFFSDLVHVFTLDFSLAIIFFNALILLTVEFYRKINSFKRAFGLSPVSWVPLKFPRSFFLFKFSIIHSIFAFEVEDLILWTLCNALILFLSELLQTCKTFLSQKSNIQNSDPHITNKFPLISILCFVFVANIGVLSLFYKFCSPFISFFMIESAIIVLDIVQITAKSFSLAMGDNINEFDDSWTDKLFWIQSLLDITILLLGFGYFGHIAIINGFNVKISGIFIFSNIQSLFVRLNHAIKRLTQYQKALNEMNSVITTATKEEINKYGGVCPICWEALESAAKIPCDHIFHRFCLRKWVEKHPKCPLCRISIKSCENYSKLWAGMGLIDSYGAELIYSSNSTELGDQRMVFAMNN